MLDIPPSKRLIVAADFKPVPIAGVCTRQRRQIQQKVEALIKSLSGTGVYIKVNSALRAVGYSLIEIIHDHGLLAFADLKLFDIPQTLSIDGAILQEVKPDLLTVACNTGRKAIKAVKDALPDTEVLGVTILTSMGDPDTDLMYCCPVADAVTRLVPEAIVGGADGLICSVAEVSHLRREFQGDSILTRVMTFNTPAIRPTWWSDPKDDQNKSRVATPADAIKMGVDRIVVGRPIIEAQDPREAVKRTIEEIATAIAVAMN